MRAHYEPGTRVSEYLLESLLGEGTFGQVWLARHHVWSDDQVAVKLPTEPEYVRYLQREGVVVHNLRHPNIVRVHGLDPFAEPAYLVMELIDGPSLADVIAEHPRGLPLPAVETILRGVLSGVAAAHDADVLHRDLKPANVLLNLGERPLEQLQVADVKLTDFGLVLQETGYGHSIAQSASLAREDQVVGTLPYLPPEIRDGRGEYDRRSDLYALGVMLFEMLTGERPAGAELPGTYRVDASSYDDIFRQLYTRHDRRYATAGDVLADLDRRQAGTPATGRASSRAFVPSCPACRAVVEPEDQFCTQCGHQLRASVRRCEQCNAYPAPEDRFCIFCGAALADAARR